MDPIAPVADAAVARLLAATPLTPEKVRFAWRLAVGPGLERATRVELQGGRLSVKVDAPAWAREIDRNRELILQRLTRLLGAGTVRVLDVGTPP